MKKVVDKAKEIWYINLAVAKTTTKQMKLRSNFGSFERNWEDAGTLITEQWINLERFNENYSATTKVEANFFEISKNL